ncbi:MAG: N-acetylmuramoyl-L-alanine amidase [Pseudomonadota bacterium]
MRAVALIFIWLTGLLGPAGVIGPVGVLYLTGLAALPTPVQGQELGALARVLPDETRLEQSRGNLTLTLGLSQGVPYRVYTLADPHQLVLEFSDVTWTGLDTEDLVSADAGPVAVGGLAPGWSGLVIPLGGPFLLEGSALRQGAGKARLTVELKRGSEAAFRAASGAPASAVALTRSAPAPEAPDDTVVVVIDPGHGGVDPGAERGGVKEADLMLMMALELRDALRRAGDFEVHLTRTEDVFTSLPARASLARQLGADAFISLHADALEEGYAEGATAYVLADEATDAASALLAERHNRADILAGVDLGGQGDEIATILLDLARLDIGPRSSTLQDDVVKGLEGRGARLNSNPRRAADFAVLRSADVPSVLVEVGFLSSERDRLELQSPEKRGRIIRGLADGIKSWSEADRVERALLRQ